ncbi:MAG: hypothetical protein M1829_006750 [Trizodia sp. TS-e1964]|nr:MAG: hypothetical protein M1829_006750 [Trizodia sp. TS-e1964]
MPYQLRKYRLKAINIGPKRLAPLELLPLELLEDIFNQSQNCNLPLASPSLLSTLSYPCHKRSIAIYIFSHGDASAQGALLRRRFFDLEFFKSIKRDQPCSPPCYSKKCVSPPEWHQLPKMFKLPPGVETPRRLLCNLRGNPEIPQLPWEPFWKIELLRRLMRCGLVPPDLLAKKSPLELRNTAHFGLQEAVVVGNLDAVCFFTLKPDIKAGIFTIPIKPNAKIIRLAVIDRDCDSLRTVYQLFLAFKKRGLRDKELEKWVQKTKSKATGTNQKSIHNNTFERYEQDDPLYSLSIVDWVAGLLKGKVVEYDAFNWALKKK